MIVLNDKVFYQKLLQMFKKYTSKEIIAGLLPRDIKVYRYLDRVYCPKVIAYVRSNSGSLEEGEELYQDTIYRVYVNVEQGKYDPERGAFGAYFMGIARKSWLNKLRERRRSIPTFPLDPSRQFTDTDEAAQEERERYYRDVKKLRSCIAQLPKKDQEMIHLFYFAKQSLDVIAQKMGLKYTYARLKICRIRDKLRDMMEDPDIDFNMIG